MEKTRQVASRAPAATRPQGVSFLGSLLEGWNRFWFDPADPTTLGLIRLCCGLLTLYVHWAYTGDLQALFGQDGWLNLATVTEQRLHIPISAPPDAWSAEVVQIDQGRHIWSAWFHVTDPRWMTGIHVGVLVVMFLFAIGFCTRVTSVLTALASLSYIQRAPTTLFGMDTIMTVALLYLMIGPSGSALSVDRLLARWWTLRRARRLGRTVPLATWPEPSGSANFALRLMQVHFCIIYFAAGTSKLLGASWWSGTALWGTLANYELAPLDSSVYQGFLLFLTRHRWLWELVMTGGVVYTLLLELGFPLLVWNRRLRWVMVAGAVFLHTGIALCMGLTLFGLLMLTLVLSFVPGEDVKRLLTAWRADRSRPSLSKAA